MSICNVGASPPDYSNLLRIMLTPPDWDAIVQKERRLYELNLRYEKRPEYEDMQASLASGAYEQAMNCAVQLSKIDEYNARALRDVAIIAVKMNDMALAEKASFEAYNKGDPKAAAWYVYVLLRQHRYDEVKAQYLIVARFWEKDGRMLDNYFTYLNSGYAEDPSGGKFCQRIVRTFPIDVLIESAQAISYLAEDVEKPDQGMEQKILLNYLLAHASNEVKSLIQPPQVAAKPPVIPTSLDVKNFKEEPLYLKTAKIISKNQWPKKPMSEKQQDEVLTYYTELMKNDRYQLLGLQLLAQLELTFRVDSYFEEAERVSELAILLGYEGAVDELYRVLLAKRNIIKAMKYKDILARQATNEKTMALFLQYCQLADDGPTFLSWLSHYDKRNEITDPHLKQMLEESINKWSKPKG